MWDAICLRLARPSVTSKLNVIRTTGTRWATAATAVPGTIQMALEHVSLVAHNSSGLVLSFGRDVVQMP